MTLNTELTFTKSNFGQWHWVVYFLSKIILVKTCYKTHNIELLTIIETFKTWWYYLKVYRYKILIFTDYNNLKQFIDKKTSVPDKSGKLKKFFITIFKSIIIKKRQIWLQMPYLAIFRGILKKKIFLALKILKFFIICNFCWLIAVF